MPVVQYVLYVFGSDDIRRNEIGCGDTVISSALQRPNSRNRTGSCEFLNVPNTLIRWYTIYPSFDTLCYIYGGQNMYIAEKFPCEYRDWASSNLFDKFQLHIVIFQKIAVNIILIWSRTTLILVRGEGGGAMVGQTWACCMRYSCGCGWICFGLLKHLWKLMFHYVIIRYINCIMMKLQEKYLLARNVFEIAHNWNIYWNISG